MCPVTKHRESKQAEALRDFGWKSHNMQKCHYYWQMSTTMDFSSGDKNADHIAKRIRTTLLVFGSRKRQE